MADPLTLRITITSNGDWKDQTQAQDSNLSGPGSVEAQEGPAQALLHWNSEHIWRAHYLLFNYVCMLIRDANALCLKCLFDMYSGSKALSSQRQTSMNH
jgi:hypothetical protein